MSDTHLKHADEIRKQTDENRKRIDAGDINKHEVLNYIIYKIEAASRFGAYMCIIDNVDIIDNEIINLLRTMDYVGYKSADGKVLTICW